MQKVLAGTSKKWLGVLIGIVAFGISGSLVILTITTKHKPNLVDEDYYEHGRKFEATIFQQMEARKTLGWDMQLQIPSELVGETITYLLGADGTYQFDLMGKDALPLRGAKVTIFAYRPSDSRADFKVDMQEAAAGNYQGNIHFPLQGAWTLTAQARLGEDVSEVARNVYVLPLQ